MKGILKCRQNLILLLTILVFVFFLRTYAEKASYQYKTYLFANAVLEFIYMKERNIKLCIFLLNPITV